MTRQEKKLLYEKRKEYSDFEIEYILDLEDIATELDDSLYNKTQKNYSYFIKIIKNIQEKEINKKIISYSEYLYGVIIPFHIEELKDEFYTYDGFDNIIKSRDWVTLVEYHPELKTLNLEFFVNDDTHPLIKEYIINSKNSWAIATGLAHHYLIKQFVKDNPNKKYKHEITKFSNVDFNEEI